MTRVIYNHRHHHREHIITAPSTIIRTCRYTYIDIPFKDLRIKDQFPIHFKFKISEFFKGRSLRYCLLKRRSSILFCERGIGGWNTQ